MNNFQKIKSFFVENKFPILIFLGLSFAISLTFPTGFSIRYSYQLNDIANEPIIAPFDFVRKTIAPSNSCGCTDPEP